MLLVVIIWENTLLVLVCNHPDTAFPNDCSPVFIFVLLTWYNLESPGKKEFQLKNCPHKISLCLSLWGIFLIGHWLRRAWCTVGSTIPRQVNLDCVRKLSEHEAVNKLVSKQRPFMVYDSAPTLPFLDHRLWPGHVSWNKAHLLLRYFWSLCSSTENWHSCYISLLFLLQIDLLGYSFEISDSSMH